MSSDQLVAIISAGGSGIGLSIAQSLHELGYRLFIVDIDPNHVAEFQRVYGEGSAQVCDVSDPHQVDTAFAAFRTKHERLDVLVNNAGIAGPQGALEDIAVDDWQRTIDTDLNSLFYMTRHAIPLMKAQRSGARLAATSAVESHLVTAKHHGPDLPELGLADPRPPADEKAELVGIRQHIRHNFVPEDIIEVECEQREEELSICVIPRCCHALDGLADDLIWPPVRMGLSG